MSEDTLKQFLVSYIVDKLTGYLMEDRHVTLEQALDLIYSSRIYDLLQDKEADLTADSPSYIYGLLTVELNG
jgi:hypothetical protein